MIYLVYANEIDQVLLEIYENSHDLQTYNITGQFKLDSQVSWESKLFKINKLRSFKGSKKLLSWFLDSLKTPTFIRLLFDNLKTDLRLQFDRLK